MNSPVFQVVLALGVLLVVAGLAIEIRAWIAGATSLTRRQKTLRLTSAVLLIAVLVMVLVGDRGIRAYHPVAAVAYWTLCLVFAASLVVLALLDLKEVAVKYGEQKKRNLKELAGRARNRTDGE